MDGQLKKGTFLTSESSVKYKVVSMLGASGISNTWQRKNRNQFWIIL